uniref:Ribosomal protein S2 n=1 Tax=Chlorella vulgaris TaxID=3077 RepID=A0A650ANM3_CHLVU|nr:ribosomal protein S2 [Chlorella vulgaris]QGN75033.1 ribosomal protein S2 [Chlorella vulgaris]USG56557.1 30S ribosomal protein S2 [Chlorella vulgaris]
MNSKNFNNWLNVSSKSLNQGIHFGHKSLKGAKTTFWHPLMSDYFLGIRQKVSLFHTQQTLKSLLRAFHIIALILNKKGRLLIINTNPEFFRLCNNLTKITLTGQGNFLKQKQMNVVSQTSSLLNEPSGTKKQNKSKHYQTFENSTTRTRSNSIQKSRVGANDCYKNLKTPQLSYISYKWIGGTLTNWKQVSKSVLTFAKFSERCEDFLVKKSLDFPKYNRVKKCFQGLLYKENHKKLLAFKQKPDLIFLVNPNENPSILREATRLHIPIVAFAESNTNPKLITYPIPVNNYSVKFIYFCFKKIIKMTHV